MTLYGSLLQHCDAGTEQRFVFPDESLALSAGELVKKADSIAAGMQALDLPHASTVLLCGLNSSALVASFLAAQKAGLIPCIVAPKSNDRSAFEARLGHIVVAATPSAVFLDDAHGPEEIDSLRSAVPSNGMSGPARIEHFSDIPLDCSFRDAREAPLSFIQFTSGSVLSPRGVMIGHANVQANCSGMATAHGWTRDDMCVCWLPLYHDMGLVGHLVPSCLVGWSIVLIDPSSFVRNPSRWLRLITDHRATVSGAPNFAYALCANRVPDRHLDGIDLTTWRHAYNGSEPIRRKEVEAFIARFAKYGFSSRTIKNVYGLAETTLAATFPHDSDAFSYLAVDAEHLTGSNRYRPAHSETTAIDIVSVGRPLTGHELRLLDIKTGAECEDGQIGEIQLSGPSVMVGYVGGDSPIQNGWLRTGDLGFRWEREIYVTGRIKDVIKKGGKNIFATDVESLCEGARTIRLAAAFEFHVGSSPKLGLVLEMNSSASDDHSQVIRDIRQSIRNRLEVSVDSVWVVPRQSIPKTTSGKIQRSLTAEMAISGVLGPPFSMAPDLVEA